MSGVGGVMMMPEWDLQIVNCYIGSLSFLHVGVILAFPATAIPAIRLQLGSELSLAAVTWLGSVSSVGALAGTLASFLFTCTQVAARRGLHLCSGAMVLGWGMATIAAQLGLLVMGAACGLASPLASLYIAEVAGSSNKGVVSSMINFNTTFGILLTNIVGSFASWSSSSVTMLTVSCALAGLMLTLVKSPYEIGRKGNHSDTELAQSVARLRRSNIEEVEREVQSLLTEIEKEKEHVSFTERLKNLNYCDVFTIFVVFVLFSVLSGMNVMTSYMVEIFRSLEVSKPVLLISYGAAELVFSFLQMTIADMFGRRTFLFLSLAGCALTTLAFSVIFWIPSRSDMNELLVSTLGSSSFLVSCVVIYVLSFNLGIGPIKHTLLSEMFRPEEQKLVAGFCHSCYWIATFVGNKVFLYLVEMFGLATMFFIISMLMVLCFIFTWLQVPETRRLKDETLQGR